MWLGTSFFSLLPPPSLRAQPDRELFSEAQVVPLFRSPRTGLTKEIITQNVCPFPSFVIFLTVIPRAHQNTLSLSSSQVDGLHDKASPYSLEETKRRILHLHGSLHVRPAISLATLSLRSLIDLFLSSPARSLQKRTRRSQRRLSGGLIRGTSSTAFLDLLSRRKRAHASPFSLSSSQLNPSWKQFAEEAFSSGTQPRTNPDGDVDLQGVSYDSFKVPTCEECDAIVSSSFFR